MAKQALVDDSYSCNFLSSGTINILHQERSGSSVYLYLILGMIKILKRINRFAISVINILVRIFLAIVYFILFFPFAVFIKLFTDYLAIKEKSPHWTSHKEIRDVKDFLNRQ